MSEPFARAHTTIVNQRGLHARAAAKFVKVAATYDAKVTVAVNGTEVPGSSILALMMLAAAPGSEVEIRAQGPAARAAVEALVRLVQKKFDED